MIDEEIRKLFQEKADEFTLGPTFPEAVTRRARRRVTRWLAGGTTVVMAAAVALALAVQSVRPPAGGTGGDSTGATVDLVAYVSSDDPPSKEQANDEGGGAGLRDFVDCMRQQGFDLPDPQRTDEGWTIPVTQRPEDTPAWREAVFVACRPGNLRLRGEMVIGGVTEATVNSFIACMGSEGYTLPEPSRSGDEYLFDLQGTGFDTEADAWHQAVFVTCGL
jgi:hypothetical protein